MSDAGVQGSGAKRQEPLVVCVVVTWNNWAHTERCLRALLRQDYGNLAIVVADNGSKDATVQQLRSAFPSAECIEVGYNAGFAKACNIGGRLGLARGAEYLWFLNNDTDAPPGTLAELVATAEADAGVGIVGARLLYMDDPTRVQAGGGGAIDLLSGYNRHYERRPAALGSSAYITFASALVRARAFAELGGLWEEIFMYFEDADFSLRAREAGWRLDVAEETAILHAESGSAAQGTRRSPLMQRIQTRSGVLFLRRHGRVPFLSVGIFLLLRVGKRVAQRDWEGLKGVLQGAAEGLRVRRDAVRIRA